MPFIPHTDQDIRDMLEVIGVSDIEQLFDEIPENLRSGSLTNIPDAMSEQEITQLMMQRAETDGRPLCFIGAGAYEHHIPAAVWEITTRGEFYSAYTPYQAEASQGTLQLLYEFQSMMTSLMSMEVSNASLYDGASALAEAVLMAIRGNRKSKSRRVLMPTTVHPTYRNDAPTLVRIARRCRHGHFLASTTSLASACRSRWATLALVVEIATDCERRAQAPLATTSQPTARGLRCPATAFVVPQDSNPSEASVLGSVHSERGLSESWSLVTSLKPV